MYDAKLSSKEKYYESKLFKPGNKLKITNLPWGKIGLSICYDLRFPGMYKKMSKQGAIFLSVPSAFTETTGKKHLGKTHQERYQRGYRAPPKWLSNVQKTTLRPPSLQRFNPRRPIKAMFSLMNCYS